MTVKTSACRVCQCESEFRFSGTLLGRSVDYFECPRCRFVQTQDPDWLDQAYDSAINLSDTGLLRRNQRNLRLVIRLLHTVGGLKKDVVDFAGGYGVLVRMLRDAGIHAKWHDPYCVNLLAKGFEVQPSWSAEMVTAFEVLEHLPHPIAGMQEAFQRSDFVLCSTQLMPDVIPEFQRWWYYGREHGQHIAFYRQRTLRWIADHFGFHLNTDGRFFHLFSRRPLARWRWQAAIRTRFLSPLIRSTKLKTLVWSDHQRFSSVSASDRITDRAA